jgi:hypothetical protein
MDEQYGFRTQRSATLNLIVFNNFFLDAVEQGSQIYVIFTDFTKAFDCVDYSILIVTLSNTGFGEPILSWLKSYLSSRIQWVKMYNKKSTVFRVPSSVPQVGHLSPIFFSLFVNVIKSAIPDSRFLMFADDLNIFRRIDSFAYCLTLQDELNTLVLWLKSIGLHFNIDKCKSMSFTRIRLPIVNAYTINSASIDMVTTKKRSGCNFLF